MERVTWQEFSVNIEKYPETLVQLSIALDVSIDEIKHAFYTGKVYQDNLGRYAIKDSQ